MDPAVAAAPPMPAGQRRLRLGVLAGTLALTAYVGAADPARSGAFPTCPSRLLLDLDCPACGSLRGTHALLRGDVAAALDHNLLLPLWLAVAGLALAAWLLPLAGRPVPAWRPPPWLLAAGAVLTAAFTVLRNLPLAGLELLSSGA